MLKVGNIRWQSSSEGLTHMYYLIYNGTHMLWNIEAAIYNRNSAVW